jgi:hypothetical protein
MKDAVANRRQKTRFIVELRYPVASQFLDQRGHVIAAIHPHIEQRLQNWQSSLDQVVWTEESKVPRTQFVIHTKRAAVVVEDSDSLQAFIDLADRLLGLTYDQIGAWLRSVERIGVRFIEVVRPRENNYEEMNAVILDRFHKTPVELPLTYTDSQTILVHERGRYAIGPTKRGDEWLSTAFQHPTENVPEIGLAVDIDSFVANPTVKSRTELLAAVRSVLGITLSVEEALLRAAGALDG